MLIQANAEDLDFIHSMVLDGSKKGYFNQEFYLNPAANNGLKKNLESILNNRKRLDEDLIAYAFIFENNGIPVSFMILSAIENQTKGIEIWMMATKKEYQKKGVATSFLDNILGQLKNNRSKAVEARCKAASGVMYHLLIKKGFELIEIDETGTRHLIFHLQN